MDDLKLSVAGEVRAYLARRQITGQQAAKQLGWNQAYLQRRLAGKVAFDVTDLAALAAFLQVPVISFFSAPGASTIRSVHALAGAGPARLAVAA